jgi:hypothetical protein
MIFAGNIGLAITMVYAERTPNVNSAIFWVVAVDAAVITLTTYRHYVPRKVTA